MNKTKKQIEADVHRYNQMLECVFGQGQYLVIISSAKENVIKIEEQTGCKHIFGKRFFIYPKICKKANVKYKLYSDCAKWNIGQKIFDTEEQAIIAAIDRIVNNKNFYI